jgi:twitching motility protein PilI
MSQESPLLLLQTMRQQAQDLAAQELTYSKQSTGVKNIAYLINDVHFYCDANLVKEVSVCENLMPVPLTKAWMRGLINSNGALYSVSDLSLLAGYERPIMANKGHVLLLGDEATQAALLVSRVIGFRYFDESHRLPDIEAKHAVLDALSSFVHTGYQVDGIDWFCLDVNSLVNSEQFREVQ